MANIPQTYRAIIALSATGTHLRDDLLRRKVSNTFSNLPNSVWRHIVLRQKHDTQGDPVGNAFTAWLTMNRIDGTEMATVRRTITEAMNHICSDDTGWSWAWVNNTQTMGDDTFVHIVE